MRHSAMAHTISDRPRSCWVESGACQVVEAFFIDDVGPFHYDNREKNLWVMAAFALQLHLSNFTMMPGIT